MRALLEKHFDDDRGAYLAGVSDQSLAEIANVPRLWVERIRETAFGPIRVSPEAQQIRADITKAQKDMVDLLGMAEDLRATVRRLSDRLARMEASHGA